MEPSMAENTKIEWTDHTFNPWEGCQKVGPGCDHCYAETRNARFSGGQAVNWGPGTLRRRTSAANWKLPMKWNKHAQLQHDAWEGFKNQNPGLTDDELIAKGFVKPRRPRVFCASLADVFDNAVDPQWRDDLFALIAATHQAHRQRGEHAPGALRLRQALSQRVAGRHDHQPRGS
jgi:protein gp37